MTQLKAYWPEAYSYLLSNLEDQKKIRYNPPYLIKGIVSEALKKYYPENNEDLKLSGIVQGRINGKMTYLSKIMQDKHMFGVLLSRQDERCPNCTLSSFCDMSYVASFLLLSPETLFFAYQKPNPEIIDCHGDMYATNINKWKAGGRTAMQLKLSKTIEKGKLAEGLELADIVHDAYQYFQNSTAVKIEIEKLKEDFYRNLPKIGNKLV